MNILIINVHSLENAGDQALLNATIEQANRIFPGCRLTVAMNDPASVAGASAVVSSFATWFRRTREGHTTWRFASLLASPWLLLQTLVALLGYHLFGRPVWLFTSSRQRDLLTAYFQADIVISTAGNFLYSSGRIGIPLFLTMYGIGYAIMVGKPVYTMPQTIGPLRRGWELVVLRWLFSRIRVVLVRDEISLQVLRAAGINTSHCAVAPDLAFLFHGAPPAVGIEMLKRNGLNCERSRPILGLTALDWGGQNHHFKGQLEYEAALAHAARRFVEMGGTVVIFPQVTGPTIWDDDRLPARRLAASLVDLGERVVLIDSRFQPKELKSAYELMDIFIGTRLHSNIFALTGGVPVVAIAYQYKTYGVLAMLGLTSWVIDIDKAKGGVVADKLVELWERRSEVQAQIRANRSQIQAAAMQSIDRIRDDYASLLQQR